MAANVISGWTNGLWKRTRGRVRRTGGEHTVCPKGIVLALLRSSWLNGRTSVTFGKRVFTCSTGGCCAGVLQRDQTEANDPDGNETAFALCRSPQTSQTRPRPLSFFVSLPLNFLSFAQTFALYLSFSTFLSGLVSCHALAGCLWTDFTACQAIYKCLHFPSAFFPLIHPAIAVQLCVSASSYWDMKSKLALALVYTLLVLWTNFFSHLFCFIFTLFCHAIIIRSDTQHNHKKYSNVIFVN